MKFIVILFAIQLGYSYVSGLECNGPHEMESGYTPVCPATCNSIHKVRCMDLIEKPSCQCNENYVRDTKTNKCVHVEQCPEYYSGEPALVCDGLNEVYREFVSVCPPTCAHPVGPFCMAMIHKPSCVCANGTIRDTINKKCVRKEECPAKKTPLLTEEKLVCNGLNEVYREVVSACPPTCAHPVGPLCMAMIRKPSCVCASGTIRDTINNKCVHREECPPKKTPLPTEEKLVCNGLNERYSDWISACPDVCPKTGVPLPEKCMAIINKPSCVCTNGAIRDTINNKCVKPNECPNHLEKRAALVCDGVNEVYREVVSACPPTCAHPVGPLCAALIRKPSCVCASGTIRDTINNKCVHKEECPPKKTPLPTEEKVVCNGLNEVFAEWVSACPSICPKTSVPLPEKCLAIVHKPSCICTNGTIRDTLNSRCVTRDQCPQIHYSEVSELKCNEENERLSPITTCQSSCQRPWIPRCDMALNESPQCVCVSGTIRDSVSGKCVHLKDCPKRTIN